MHRWITLIAGIFAGFAALLGLYAWLRLGDHTVAFAAFAAMAALAVAVTAVNRRRRTACKTPAQS